MAQRIAVVLACVGGLVSVPAFSQTQPNPTQQETTTPQISGPVYRVTVVGRTTPAINYRPRSGETKIDFVGTPLLPQARGDATIKGERGYIRVDANFENLEPATKFGPEYLTYVVWAITPEGRATNLGELQVSGDDGELDVTTELQAFGLVVTAEPYFAVSQPSDVVVMENAFRKEGIFQDATVGGVEVIDAKYELLKRGSYLMNQNPAQFEAEGIKPGVPLDLAEARNAVNLARLAGADRYAADTFNKAAGLLAEAEKAAEGRRFNRNAVMMPARQAAQTAEDSRLIALQRQEEEYNAQQKALAQQRENDALERARAEELRRRQAELDAQAAAQAAAAARAAADRERADADAARAASEAARASAEAARLAAEQQARDAQASAEAAERERAALRDKLREQLNIVLETRETARGLIVNLSDVLFDFDSANLKPGAREKLAKIAGILLTYPGLEMELEGHTDSIGSDAYNQRLSEQRAESVRNYLLQNGIKPDLVQAMGFGESQPVVSNESSAGRQQNRRVELVVSGEAIEGSAAVGTTGKN